MKTALNFLVSLNAGNFFTSCEGLLFSQEGPQSMELVFLEVL